MPAWLMTSGAAATTPGCLPHLGQHLLPVVHPEPGAEGKDAEVRIGDQDPLAKVVPQAVHHAEHHDQRHDPDGDPAGRDHGVERRGARAAAAPQVPLGDPPLEPVGHRKMPLRPPLARIALPLGPHGGEEDHVANGRLIGHQS